MVVRRRPRDSTLIDAIEAAGSTEFAGSVWRVARAGRDPTLASSPSGRWDDGTFDVLYTSTARDGAAAEIHFHLSRGQPVFPSQIEFHQHELHVVLKKALKIPTRNELAKFGVETSAFGAMTHARRNEEYGRAQQLAEVAHFLEFDGLIVPSARHPAPNAILLVDRFAPENLRPIRNHGPVDWASWRPGTGR